MTVVGHVTRNGLVHRRCCLTAANKPRIWIVFPSPISSHSRPLRLSLPAHHCSSYFVQPSPCCLVATQAKYSLQAKSACTIFLAGYPPDRSEPYCQRTSTTFKNSATFNRCLISAILTLKSTISNWPGFAALTTRAYKPIWPTKRDKISLTFFFRGKLFFQFHKSFWIIFHTPLNYMLGVPESRGYPLKVIRFLVFSQKCNMQRALHILLDFLTAG